MTLNLNKTMQSIAINNHGQGHLKKSMTPQVTWAMLCACAGVCNTLVCKGVVHGVHVPWAAVQEGTSQGALPGLEIGKGDTCLYTCSPVSFAGAVDAQY